MTEEEQQPNEIIQEVEHQFNRMDPGSFSPRAFQRLKSKISWYVRSLIVDDGVHSANDSWRIKT